MFHSHEISYITNCNKFLQRDEPCIHILKQAIESFGKILVGRIFKPVTLCNAQSAFDVDLDDDSFKDRRLILRGMSNKNDTKQTS